MILLTVVPGQSWPITTLVMLFNLALTDEVADLSAHVEVPLPDWTLRKSTTEERGVYETINRRIYIGDKDMIIKISS